MTIDQITAAFSEAGRRLAEMFEKRLANLPRCDQSGWFYISATTTAAADGRARAYIKPLSGAVSSANPQLGPLPCVRSYTPVVGHRVMVTWVAGDRADGCIMG